MTGKGVTPARIVIFAPYGSADTEALGVAANGATDGLEAILGGGDLSRLLAGSLRRRGLDTTKYGAPGRIRTCDPRIRNPVLYPLSYGRQAGGESIRAVA